MISSRFLGLTSHGQLAKFTVRGMNSLQLNRHQVQLGAVGYPQI